MHSQIKSVLLIIVCIYMVWQPVAMAATPIDVFSIDEEKVVYQTEGTPQAQHTAQQLIQSIDGLVTAINPLPASGYLVKVTFDQPYYVKNYWFHAAVTQAIFVYDKGNPSSVMLINEENQSIFFTLSRDVEELFALIQFKPTLS
ncbi:hypothetical protein [Shouchella lehensis]|uniref:Uncharacterized protein n=2 Tax=Shouchella lehensis TaxID=300825 RepID=A0A4Y7WEV6_9BACI|nr:hypothetical protein [Shouchella lehensis]MBG9784864.1 hypothetical protein [Shouchella lehensis]TES46278.1 hypothetical protein E2L03_16360 [Shouchella lehensis]